MLGCLQSINQEVHFLMHQALDRHYPIKNLSTYLRFIWGRRRQTYVVVDGFWGFLFYSWTGDLSSVALTL